MSTQDNTQQQDLNLSDLNADQLKALQAQLATASKERRASRKVLSHKWLSIVDPMLERVDGEFKHTTQDIWQRLYEEGVEKADPMTEDQSLRDNVLKRIQKRKQVRIKKGEDVGYAAKPSVTLRNFTNIMNILKAMELSEEEKAELRKLAGPAPRRSKKQ